MIIGNGVGEQDWNDRKGAKHWTVIIIGKITTVKCDTRYWALTIVILWFQAMVFMGTKYQYLKMQPPVFDCLKSEQLRAITFHMCPHIQVAISQSIGKNM